MTLSDRGTRLVDLSLDMTNQMPAHALFPSPTMIPYVTHEMAKAAGLGEPGDPMTYCINYISTLEHVGTHVDAPLHISAEGASIDQVSLECANSRVPISLIGLLSDKTLLVGAIDVATNAVETPEQVAAVIGEALNHADAERIQPCTNCGLAPLPRGVAVGKLNALGAGAALARKRFG